MPVMPISLTLIKNPDIRLKNVVSTQWVPVGDEAGHVIGVQQREGEAVLSSGESTKYSTASTFDSRRGNKGGTSQGYSIKATSITPVSLQLALRSASTGHREAYCYLFS